MGEGGGWEGDFDVRFQLLTAVYDSVVVAQPVDAVPVCPRPFFSVDDDSRIQVDYSIDEFVVNTRVVQQQPVRSRAAVAQHHLSRTCAAAGTDLETVRRRTLEHLGGVEVEEE